MNKIRNFWKKLKYWQKGGIIGGLIGFLYYFLPLILHDVAGLDVGNYWLGALSFCLIDSDIDLCFYSLSLPYGWIFSTILYGILGAILGLIIEMIKKK